MRQRKNRNISLPHSLLITELCQSAEIHWDEDEEVLKLQVPVKVPTRQTMEGEDRTIARTSWSTSQYPNEPRHQWIMNQRMDALEHGVENLYMNSATFMTYQVEFNTALAHHFPDPNQMFP